MTIIIAILEPLTIPLLRGGEAGLSRRSALMTHSRLLDGLPLWARCEQHRSTPTKQNKNRQPSINWAKCNNSNPLNTPYVFKVVMDTWLAERSYNWCCIALFCAYYHSLHYYWNTTQWFANEDMLTFKVTNSRECLTLEQAQVSRWPGRVRLHTLLWVKPNKNHEKTMKLTWKTMKTNQEPWKTKKLV